MPTVAKIAVADATMAYDKLYSYLVPAHLAGHVFVGATVLVPFGRGHTKPRVGMVLEVGEEAAPKMRLKAILDAKGAEASLPEELLAIVKYLKAATLCTWFEALRAVVPFGAQYRAGDAPGGWQLETRLTQYHETFYELASTGAEADAANGGKTDTCGCDTAETAEPASTAKQPRARKETPQQRAVLDFLAGGERSRREILAECDVSPGVLDTLLKNGKVAEAKRDRAFSFAAPSDGLAKMPRLSPQQQAVADVLLQKMADGPEKPAYLYGVTGSGKTAVFLHVIAKALEDGKTALVLVPEIGLTTQMVARLVAVFGEKVAVQHSGLSHGERLLQWRAIARGDTPVVVGTRSAVFAPLDNIGAIVIDEEQERSYKSESAPRYDALDIARRRAARHKALLLLASATPDVESYYRAETGAYDLVTLKRRYGDLPLPAVEIVDMHDELFEGNPSFLSRRLVQEIHDTIAAGRQAVLLLNRRGYHRVGVCRTCREVVKCEQCSVPMVLHVAGAGARPVDSAGAGPGPDGPVSAPAAPLLQAERNATAAMLAAPVNGESAEQANGNVPLSKDDAFALWKSIAPKPKAKRAAAVKPGDDTLGAPPHEDDPEQMYTPTAYTQGAEGAVNGPSGLGPAPGQRLLCHCCGAQIAPAPQVCPKCGGEIKYTGFGTQKMEDELLEKLPGVKILRMDTDSTSRKGSHAAMLRQFAKGNYDILLGTQMVAKGLDFERVGLVGVVGIDSLLYSDGFRAFERVFALITQVVGRAGRKGEAGRAIIQTNDPENPVILLAAQQDYERFYETEIALRRQLIYPPFCSVCTATFSAPDDADAEHAARTFAAMLVRRAKQNEAMPLRILGPAPMHVAQMAGAWRWRLTLKSRGDAAFRQMLADTAAEFGGSPAGKKTFLSIDFNADT